MREVFVAGTASTRFAKQLDTSLRSLAEEATAGALADAGAQPDDVEAVFFSNATAGLITGQEMIRGQVALRDTGLLGVPLANIENACASGSTAFNLACTSVAAGLSDVAITVGAEKLTHEDKARTFAAFSGAVDMEEAAAQSAPASRSLFMDIYAGMARSYMGRSGATREHFAQVAVKARRNGAKNPKAQHREEVTIEQVLEAREVTAPLTVPMCSPISDGACALVLASRAGLERLDADPVSVIASVVLSGGANGNANVVTRAAQRAYAMAQISPGDLDLVELHDAAAPAELIVPEEIGIARPDGGGIELLMSGESEVAGRLPINPSGGLLSKGHPVGATGCAQIAEISDQLRGRCTDRQVDAATIGLAENGGGWIGSGPAAATITILRR